VLVPGTAVQGLYLGCFRALHVPRGEILPLLRQLASGEADSQFLIGGFWIILNQLYAYIMIDGGLDYSTLTDVSDSTGAEDGAGAPISCCSRHRVSADAL
jgi:hypothetical protein